MRTRRPISALVVAAGLAAAACGGSPGTVASHSPTPQASHSALPTASAPTPSPALPPLSGAYGVLVTTVTGGGSYAVAIVGVDGKVDASAQASSPAGAMCANSAAAVVPLPVSTSDHRLYFMDAAGAVRYLGPNGDSGQATTVPAGTASRRSMFAVSPDDQRIAVVVDDFTSSGATTRLYVENLNGGGNHVNVFAETGAYTLWPIGWHGTNNLVVAKVPSCTQGGGPFCCGPLELHVIDPATASRRFTIGSSSSCVIVGPASPAGAVCENSTFTTAEQINWTAGVFNSFPISGPVPAFLSPDGNLVAIVNYASGVTNIRVGGQLNMQACEWIDSAHLLAGGDAQQQPRVGNVTNGTVVPVAAQGDCGGRLPGGL